MKLKKVFSLVPLLLLSVAFVVVAVRFKAKQRRVQATRDLVQLCESKGGCNQQIILEALQAGANPNARTSEGEPLLAMVSALGAQELIAAGANVNARDKDGITPLMALMERARDYDKQTTQGARVLLKHGADPNLRDHRGCTALQRASHLCGESECWCNSEIARMLLAKGAQVDVLDNEGNTALCRVVPLVVKGKFEDNDSVEFVRLLLAYGADPQYRNEQGRTPLSLAHEYLTGNTKADHEMKRVIVMMRNAIEQRKAAKPLHELRLPM